MEEDFFHVFLATVKEKNIDDTKNIKADFFQGCYFSHILQLGRQIELNYKYNNKNGFM